MNKVIIAGIIEVKTGLHIGSNEAEVRIGGLENGVIKDKNGKPYIPGSSIKGKMRCLLERELSQDKIIDNYDEPIGRLFGISANKKVTELRRNYLIIRDASLVEVNDMDCTELKMENVIDRKTGTAKHPRTIERVVKGTKFNFEFVFNSYYKKDDEEETNKENEEDRLLKILKKGMKLLENDYLGGNGTRGYGQIHFKDMKYNIINFDEESNKENISDIFNNIDELITALIKELY